MKTKIQLIWIKKYLMEQFCMLRQMQAMDIQH